MATKKAHKNKTSPSAPSSAKEANPVFQHRLHEAVGLILLFVALLAAFSLVSYSPNDPSLSNATPAVVVNNYGGRIGAILSDIILQQFGLSGFVLPLVLGIYAVLMVTHKERPNGWLITTTLPVLVVSMGVLLHVGHPLPNWPTIDGIGNGGLVGKLAATLMLNWLGMFGTLLLNGILTLLGLMWLSGLTLQDIYYFGARTAYRLHTLTILAGRYVRRVQFQRSTQIDLPLMPKEPVKKPVRAHVEVMMPKAEPIKKAERNEDERQDALPLELGDGYALPPLRLLDENPQQKDVSESPEALQQNARMLEQQLANFGVKGVVTKICPGPVITIYELEPAPGVKTSQVVGLADDLARAMSAQSVRVAPIPGRTVIGIEMPNRKRKMVVLRDLLGSEQFESDPGKLAVALGVTSTGEPAFADIAKMPHALIAGTTGSGKSVAMNAFILSLLYRLTPEELRFVMIDPKMLELSIYNDIPHLLHPVITDPNKASAALKWVVREMENRYRLMSELGVKNIQSFNAKFAEMQSSGKIPTRLVQTGFNPETGQPVMEEQPLAKNPLPYIVVVIDELADLMMVAGKEVEQSIARIAQMARAAGIHLLVATQRPSVDVVTGLIKANIPTRMSFNVTSKIDSRTVLDSMGAEQLLGKGDMLYMGNGSNSLQRLHGAFVSEEECHAVAEYLKEQAKPNFVDLAAKGSSAGSSTGGDTGAGAEDEADALYQEAIELVAREQRASTSFIQRHLQVGYNRAARMIEQLERDGMVSPPDHVGRREVIVRKPPEGGYSG